MHYVISLTLVAIFQLSGCLACAAQAVATAAAEPEGVAAAAAGDGRSASVDLLQQMTSEGIRLTDELQYRLPAPTFVSIGGESVDEATARQAIGEIAGRHGVSRFTRNSIVAPIYVKTESINDPAGERIGHFIDVAFVVHQSIAEVRESKPLDDFKSAPDEPEQAIEAVDHDSPDELETSRTRALTKQEMAQYGVTLESQYESLGWLQLPLMSKVVIRGVARARRSVWSSEDSDAPIILTWLLDSRFGADAPQADSIANQWRAIERTSTGERMLGPPHPYAGMGGYVAITAVPDEPQASMVQLRFVIHEPPAWFAGRNLLRSKLPIMIQDRVRNLRRELQGKS